MNGYTIRECLEEILSNYLDARATGTVSSKHPINSAFARLQKALQTNPIVAKHPTVTVKPSVGKGIWATIPWVALLDSRETKTVQEGVYCVFLFREDMSGVYLTLNQGVTKLIKQLTRKAGRQHVQKKAEELRKHAKALSEREFNLDNNIDLHTDNPLGTDYEYSTIAYKLYPRGNVPPDEEILEDINVLLDVYENYIETTVTGGLSEAEQKQLDSISEPQQEKQKDTLDLKNLIDYISSEGFVFEPWHIAAYVTALRTKPFAILAGVSGTGKSKLPALVAKATGGVPSLIPVRPDWTDSSDLLGYVDIQGQFRPGLLLDFAHQASQNPERYFVCIIDEMNLARVEHYFAEVLSRIEDRHPVRDGGYASNALLSQKLEGNSEWWANQGLPPNLAIVGTVNMDETTHAFSRKVLDRAFTIELSDINLNSWQVKPSKERSTVETWPASKWYPKALRIGDFKQLSQIEREVIGRVTETLGELNGFLSQAQLQVGYRIRDEISLFVIHSRDCLSSFVTSEGESVDPLDLAIQMKILPRIVGGSSAIRQVVLKLLYWAYDGEVRPSEDDAIQILELWDSENRPGSLEGARFPRAAARLCLMWDRLMNDGFTSFWL